jgi:UTP--glucose-1-phosphate uridylyltransferase
MSLSLDDQLQRLSPEVRATLERHGFDAARLKRLAARLGAETAEDNFVKGRITPPRDGDVVDLPAVGSPARARLEERGREALRAGRVAIVVLAGGMATRMGGVVKALVDAVPGKSFLDLRLAEVAAIGRRFGRVPPLWLMSSHATDGAIRAALAAAGDAAGAAATFTQ